jgi:hypothetical protein
MGEEELANSITRSKQFPRQNATSDCRQIKTAGVFYRSSFAGSAKPLQNRMAVDPSRARMVQSQIEQVRDSWSAVQWVTRTTK